MEQFLRQLQTIPEVAELIRRVEDGGCPAAVSGLQPVQRACVGAAVAAGSGRPAVFLCGDEREVQVLAGDLETLTGTRPVTLLGREWQFRPGAVGSRDWERSRLAALYALARGEASAVVATVDAVCSRTLPPELLRSLAVTLTAGGQAELRQLTERLLSAGYTRCDQVEGVGQFALRGGILDVFSPLMDQPVRCEFFDDEIDSMGAFDPGSQRRTRNVKSALILPAAEVLPHCAEGGVSGLAESSPPWRTDWPAGRRRSRSSRPCGRTRSGCGAARPHRPRTGIWRPSTRRSPPAWTICPRMRRCSSARAAGWTSG